jgi:hypothetical protein
MLAQFIDKNSRTPEIVEITNKKFQLIASEMVLEIKQGVHNNVPFKFTLYYELH